MAITVIDKYGKIKQSKNQALRLDDTSTANVIYIGYAPVASSEASAVWQIKRLNVATGLTITWADGNAKFDNVWSNRTSLVYI